MAYNDFMKMFIISYSVTGEILSIEHCHSITAHTTSTVPTTRMILRPLCTVHLPNREMYQVLFSQLSVFILTFLINFTVELKEAHLSHIRSIVDLSSQY